jgi:hypothetical protein
MRSPGSLSIRIAMLALLGMSLARAPLHAQQPAPERSPGWSMLRIAKWSTLALSTGAAVYGFTLNSGADDRYEELEQACVADPSVCRLRTPEGAYRSEDLERRYQDVLDRDRAARRALLASQVGVAASVVLFILDLRNARGPDDIIYDPPALEVSPRRDGAVELRLNLRSP